MTTTLVAVYAPIGFMGGLVGTLFTEFAFSLAGAVLISGVVALTLSPMLSSQGTCARPESRALRAGGRTVFRVRWPSSTCAAAGRPELSAATLLFALVVLASIYFMFTTSKNELAPTEDQSILFFQAVAPQTASLEYNEAYTREIIEAFESVPEYHESFLLLGFGGDDNVVFGGFKMPPADQRERSQMEVQPEVQGKLRANRRLPDRRLPASQPARAAAACRVQFVIQSDGDYQELDRVADQLIGRGMASGQFLFLTQVGRVQPSQGGAGDRPRPCRQIWASSMDDIGRNLATLLGGNYVNRFSLDGRSYKVIPQAERAFRLTPEMLGDFYLRSATGDQVPLSALVQYRDLGRAQQAHPVPAAELRSPSRA